MGGVKVRVMMGPSDNPTRFCLRRALPPTNPALFSPRCHPPTQRLVTPCPTIPLKIHITFRRINENLGKLS